MSAPLKWTHYPDGSHSAASEAGTYAIRRDFGLDKWALTLTPTGGSFPDRYVYKLRSLRALMLIAQDHANELLSLPGESTIQE